MRRAELVSMLDPGGRPRFAPDARCGARRGWRPGRSPPVQVLLLHLPLARRSYLARFSLVEPMGQLYLAPALVPRHRVRLVDLRVTPDLDRELGDYSPEVVVVGVNPLSFAACGGVLSALRHRFPGLKVLLVADAEYGNGHVGEHPHDFVHPLADALVVTHFLAPMVRVVRETIAAWEEGHS